MDVRVFHVFVYILLSTWAVECAYGTFADFLEHLPKKMGKAFEVTWARMKDLNVNKRFTRRQIMEDNYYAPVPNLYIKQSSGNMENTKLRIPILRTPNSKYRYLWRSTEEEQKRISDAASSSELPTVLPITKSSLTDLKKQDTTHSVAFDVVKSKHFRLRVFYKWELGFL